METDNEFKDISDLLSGIKSGDGQKNLLELLSKMFDTKMELNDDRLYTDQFEDISIRIKKNGQYINDKLKRETLMKYLEDYIKNIKPKKTLLETLKNPPEEGSDAEPTPIASVSYIDDYYSLFSKISWAGISLSEKESFLLTNSMRNLSYQISKENEGSEGKLSFFGKIYGTEKDYYIVQVADLDAPADYPYDADMEKRKEDGVNQFTYYVTNDLTTKWVALPEVKPSQIMGSRLIRYTFTGDLKRQIYTNPYFNGQEQHYLKCQIVRIYHGAKLVPSINHYTIEDPENPFKAFIPSEKPKPFKHEDLINLKTWIHYPPSILKQGRVSHFMEEAPEDADPEEFKKKILAADPFEKRIKPVTEDNYINGASSISNIKISPWKLSLYLEDKIYTNPYIKLLDEKAPDYDPNEQKDNKCDYTLICIKSLLWPGAYNFYLNKTCYFFYFGFGLKFSDIPKNGPFVYKSFPILPSDFEDLPDQPEPTIPPKEPGEEQEENKEGEQEPNEGGKPEEGAEKEGEE